MLFFLSRGINSMKKIQQLWLFGVNWVGLPIKKSMVRV